VNKSLKYKVGNKLGEYQKDIL